VTVLDRIAALISTRDLELRKAAPRGDDRLVLELRDRTDLVSAGQWYAEPARGRHAAAAIRAEHGTDRVDVLDAGQVIVQRGGADVRLRGLRRQVAAPGSVLVAHRPERRGVVRTADGSYTKLVRPGRTAAVASPLRALAAAGLRVPEVVEADDRAGVVRTALLPGRTLHELVVGNGDDADVRTAAWQVGTVVRHLHALEVDLELPAHGPVSELTATRAWLTAAAQHGLLAQRRWEAPLDTAARLLSGPRTASVLLHRDLHDKQLLIAPGEEPGLLDLDLASRGEPALDLANLLVHLELRRLQGRCTPDRVEACTAAVLEAYRPDPTTLARLPGYAATARLRLAAVYAFRGAPADVVDTLLRPVVEASPAFSR
jgi:streptomycin 6-kinase